MLILHRHSRDVTYSIKSIVQFGKSQTKILKESKITDYPPSWM